MEKLITFIIPSYNVEKYLKTCLDSFLIKEEEGLNRVEVIIVDDGSTDGTADITGTYVKRYPEIYRLIQKENGGHGSVINIGSRAAVGKYMKVIDADDWIVRENLSELLKKLEICEADVVLTPFHRVNMTDNSREIWRMYCARYETVYSLEQVLSAYTDFERCLTFHGIMYRTEFYKKCGHHLPERIFYEDQEYAAIPCCYARSIVPIDLYLYQYLVGNSQQSVATANRIKHIDDLEAVAQNILHCAEKEAEAAAPNRSARKRYLFKKAEEVILSYYITTCLLHPDRRSGLKQAAIFTSNIQRNAPEIKKMIQKKYRLFCYMCRMHISYSSYEKILRSWLYSTIRRKHQLNREMS